MPEENENKIEENKPEENKNIPKKNVSCKTCSPWTVTMAIVIVLVIVGGVATAGAVAMGHHNQSRFGGRVEFAGGYGRGGMMRGGMMGRARGIGRSAINGKITAVNGDTITVNANNKDFTVNIADTTQIYNTTNIASKSDLKTDQTVIVRGLPNSSGQINAIIIRIK